MATRTHQAVVITNPRAPLELRQVPTASPVGDEVLVRVAWTASTPFDLHQADGGLLVESPQRTGAASAGVVAEVGPDATRFKVGDRIFGYAHLRPEWKAHQEYATAPEWVFGKVPDGFSMEQAVTLPENLVTAFHTMVTDLDLPAPWPKPSGYVPPRAEDRVLVWGGASSVGQYMIAVLRFYGYRHVVATASPRHHAYLAERGAEACFDYNSPTVVEDLLAKYGQPGPAFPLIVDCIGSLAGSLGPVSRIAAAGTTVAAMLPVVVKHATDTQAPEYSLDLRGSVPWADGVDARGVRTHGFHQNEFFKKHLQTEIIPCMLASGHVVPNRFRVVEGDNMLDRASKALALLRKGVSGEKLVWRVSDE
ncbi:GroES-like protein [Hypoxylon sp. FL1284]|nr:GroES-like protein [Hypoxylon sp. FL1284]